MFRPAICFGVIALVIGVARPVAAQETVAPGLVAPSPAVAAAWAREAKERQMLQTRRTQEDVSHAVLAPSAAVAAAWAKEAERRETLSPTSSTSLKVMYGSYGVLQGLDMYSTIVARQKGAREVNPIMDVGYGQASVLKGLLAAGTLTAVKKIAKKNRKAAVITMVAVNVATAAIVANNFRNARRLQ